jgi:hypothetical protein
MVISEFLVRRAIRLDSDAQTTPYRGGQAVMFVAGCSGRPQNRQRARGNPLELRGVEGDVRRVERRSWRRISPADPDDSAGPFVALI